MALAPGHLPRFPWTSSAHELEHQRILRPTPAPAEAQAAPRAAGRARQFVARIALSPDPTLAGPIPVRSAAGDMAFLAVIGVLSFALYVGNLGFYSDDWGFLMRLGTAADTSLGGLYEALVATDPVIAQRPPQVLELSVLYSLFGLEPLGYHLVNGAVLVAAGLGFYLVLRELRAPRALALTAPLVYLLMPHFSTDRFWVSAFQATLSIALYFLSLYADLRAVGSERVVRWLWKAAALAALAGSGLAYEVVLPLLAFNLAIVALVHQRRESNARSGWGPWALLAPNALALLGVIAYKASTTVRVGSELSYADHLAYVVSGSTRVNFGTYGVALPYVTGWIVANRLDWPILLGALVMGALSGLYLRHILAGAEAAWPPTRTWMWWMAIGGLAYALGYATFVVHTDVWFTSTSLGNRIGIAAAVGLAVVVTGALGTAASLGRGGPLVFASLTGAVCGAFFLATNTLGAYWTDASRVQQAVMSDVRRALPAPEARTTLILKGVCVTRGGAWVFTGTRDVAGLLVLRYGDPSLGGTVLHTYQPRIGPDGISIRTFRAYRLFRYGPRLLLYDRERGRLARLTGPAAAERALGPPEERLPAGCPEPFAWARDPIVP